MYCAVGSPPASRRRSWCPAVQVLVFEAPQEVDPRHGDLPGADIGQWLARHGVRVEVARVATTVPVGEAMLSTAADLQADLIVIGGYRPPPNPAPRPPPLQALDQTPIEALNHLQELQDLPNHLVAHGLDATARRMAARICAFFGEKARSHHADEERHVFPQLLRSNDAE